MKSMENTGHTTLKFPVKYWPEVPRSAQKANLSVKGVDALKQVD